MAEKFVLWQWRVRLKPGASSPWFSTKTWKLLRGKMTGENAVAWGTENGCDMQKGGGSREEVGGNYLGIDGPSPPMACSPDYRKREGG